MKKTLTTIVKMTKNKYIEKETGYMICENATLGSIGMQEYFAGDLQIEGVAPSMRVKVYRPAEEVFKPESLASLENKAFTVYHPDEMVNSENDSQLRKGSVYNVRRVGDTIVGDIQITDKDTIEKVKYIKCLSLGYNLDLDKMDDTEDSYIARNIKYNHLALVPKGRSKVAQINDNDDDFYMEDEYMSLFRRNVKVADEETKTEGVEETTETEVADTEEEKEEKTEVEEKVEEEEKTEVEDTAECGDEEKATEEEKTETDVKDEDEEKTEQVEETKEENKKDEKEDVKVKDGGDMTLEEIDKLADAEVRKIALAEYKAKAMADKGLIYGDDNSGFTKPAETPKAPALDAELERRKYYRNDLNPHKNPNWRSECVNANDVIVF